MNVIAALASPPGEGAIGVIELFGDGAVDLVAGIFQSPRGAVLKDSRADDLFYGKIIEGKDVIDEVLVKITSRDPDHLEINCHGGAVPHTAIMALLVRLGTRKCPWRELFATAGRAEGLDAVQIEAGVRLPGALTLTASMMLVAQYNGALSRAAREGDLFDLRNELLQLAPYGLALCEPPKLVVAGRPNVGKSTLTNALLGVERVITSPTPGTTRDAVASFLDIDGVPFELFDTAGLGSARGELEELGKARALETIASADIVLCVIDGSCSVSNKDKRLLELCCGKKAVAVISKSDLSRIAAISKLDLPEGMPLVEVSATQGTGLEELRRAILETLFPVVPPDVNRPIPFTARQIELLTRLDKSNVAEIASSLRYV